MLFVCMFNSHDAADNAYNNTCYSVNVTILFHVSCVYHSVNVTVLFHVSCVYHSVNVTVSFHVSCVYHSVNVTVSFHVSCVYHFANVTVLFHVSCIIIIPFSECNGFVSIVSAQTTLREKEKKKIRLVKKKEGSNQTLAFTFTAIGSAFDLGWDKGRSKDSRRQLSSRRKKNVIEH